jgi:hypothetical protein
MVEQRKTGTSWMEEKNSQPAYGHEQEIFKHHFIYSYNLPFPRSRYSE